MLNADCDGFDKCRFMSAFLLLIDIDGDKEACKAHFVVTNYW